MQLLAPPADDAPRHVSGTSRVEFSVSLQTVYDEREVMQPLPPVREPSADVLGEEGEERLGSAGASAAVSRAMSTALQTDMEIEEEAAASLRAELVAVEPAPTVKEYDVEVRAEQEDLLVQFSTSAGRLFCKAYKLYSNMLEVRGVLCWATSTHSRTRYKIYIPAQSISSDSLNNLPTETKIALHKLLAI